MDRGRRPLAVITVALAMALLMVPLASLTPLNEASITAKAQGEQWPWSNKTEPFPWLDYLKSLPHDNGVTLQILTRHESTITEKTLQLFLNSEVAKELGIKNIVFGRAPPVQWVDLVQKSIQRGNPIDIAWGGGPTLFNMLDDAGLLEPLNPQAQPAYYAVLYEASKIPDTISGAPTKKMGPDGYIHWIGAAVSSFGFTINTSMINKYQLPTPKTWEDLTRPEYAKYLPEKPLIGIADPTKSTSNTRMYEIILQAYGWDQGWKILTLMAANAQIYQGSSLVRDAVIRGDIAAGITIDFYGYTAQQQSPYCKYILPAGKTIVNADPIAIIKGTKHPVQAAAFVAWVLSEYGGQQLWLDHEINRLPINPAVFNTSAGQQRPDLKRAFEEASKSQSINFSETLASQTEKAMQIYFVATLVKPHDVLQNVWAQIAKAYLNGSITKEQYNMLINNLTKPFPFQDPITGQNVTFTLDYAKKINKELGKPDVYQTLISEWNDGATQRYLHTLDLLKDTIKANQAGQGGGAGGGQSAGKGYKQITVIVIGIIIIALAAYFLFLRK